MRLHLAEDVAKHFMTKKERQLKTELIKLLRDHRHAKYAARFELFDLNIVPLAVDPKFTAAVSFDDGVIFISEGFINGDRAVFEQLDMVLRHELAHNLLMHQVRMIHKLGEKTWLHVKFSSLIHDLWNIIEDDEISNTRYTAADKVLARHLIINGKIIKGLVTEDHRKDWINLSVEQMYEQLKKEIASVHTDVMNNSYYARYGYDDYIKREIHSTFIYRAIDKPSSIRRPMEVFLKGATFKAYPIHIKSMIQDICNSYTDAPEAAITKALTEISESSPIDAVTIVGPDNTAIELYTPEEKWLAVQVLNNLAGNINYNPVKYTVKRGKHSKAYIKQYNKTISAFDKNSIDDKTLEDVLADLQKLADQAAEENDEMEIDNDVSVSDASKVSTSKNTGGSDT